MYLKAYIIFFPVPHLPVYLSSLTALLAGHKTLDISLGRFHCVIILWRTVCTQSHVLGSFVLCLQMPMWRPDVVSVPSIPIKRK